MANRLSVRDAIVAVRAARADRRAAVVLRDEALVAFRAARDNAEAPDADDRNALAQADIAIALAAAKRQYELAHAQLNAAEDLLRTRIAAADALADVP